MLIALTMVVTLTKYAQGPSRFGRGGQGRPATLLAACLVRGEACDAATHKE